MLGTLAARYDRVFPVFIRHGLAWESAELQCLRRFLRAVGSSPAWRRHPRGRIQALTVLHLPVRDLYGKHWSVTGRGVPAADSPDEAVYLPGRNLLLLSQAALFCVQRGIHTIAVGSLQHNPFPDATPRFFRAFSAAASRAFQFRLRVVAPFRALTKTEVVRRGRALPLHLSFCCLAPVAGRHCGRCNKCAERRHAFAAAGLADRTRYDRA